MAPKTKDPAFTNFTIKVNVDGSWHNTVEKVLKSVKGVTKFRMENDGRINISGYINPNVLLECFRKAGKNAQIVHWQYGECSSNLYETTTVPSSYYGHGSSNYYYGDGYGYNNNGCYNNGYYCNGYPGYGSNDAYNSYTEKPRSSRGHDTDCSIM